VNAVALDPGRRYATLTFLRGALVALAVTLVFGLLAALYTIPALAPSLRGLGLDLRQLRPLHDTFASVWIFLGGATIVHHFLACRAGPMTAGDRWRLRVQLVAWAAAGVGILVSLLARVGSGREYLGFHPALSALIVIGWLCYLWNFFRVVGRSFWREPVYVTMWGVAFLFFLYTFLEQHAYLLPRVFADPVRDLQIQWKATGTLVGSYNLFVYGTLIYATATLAGDDRYAHSPTAYALFTVGLLNSFTNFGHHTYHLPQRPLVNWISFLVSMTEIAVLARAMTDLWRVTRAGGAGPADPVGTAFAAARWWTVAILFTAVLISVPPVNALIHGTYVVTGHAMGATIGIDTMILLGAVLWVMPDATGRAADPAGARAAPAVRRAIVGLNLGVAALVLWLHVSGLVTALTRIRLSPDESYVPPPWLGASNGIAFATTGALAAAFFAALLARLLPAAFRPGR
jgi:nitric oxide reductase subunit B